MKRASANQAIDDPRYEARRLEMTGGSTARPTREERYHAADASVQGACSGGGRSAERFVEGFSERAHAHEVAPSLEGVAFRWIDVGLGQDAAGEPHLRRLADA